MNAKLSSDVERVAEEHDGFVQIPGDRSSYVVMRMDLYREMLGVGTDDEFEESIIAVREGLADIDAGRTRPYKDVLAELG